MMRRSNQLEPRDLHMTNLKVGGLGLVLVGVGALTVGCAAGKADKPLPTYSETRTEKATATVVAVDQATRKVTLKPEQGEAFDFVAGPQVKNLAQVQAGDIVTVEYVESIALEVRRADGTQPDAAVAVAGGSAKLGEMPAGVIGDSITVSAVIVAIDTATLRVTVKGPQGNLRVLQAKDPKKVAAVKVGDMVYVTYTEALGISVDKAKAAPAAAPAK
jgi:Cu/Ag efflux protein CusF